jgi:dTMP kinase
MNITPLHPDSGRFLVFEGIGAVGKTTQVGMLVEGLRQRYGAEKVVQTKFPRYDTEPYGPLIRQYLDNVSQDPANADPYGVGRLYANDRLGALPGLAGQLAAGNIVVADRYIPSNLAYQGAKLSGEERTRYIDWQMNLEYETNGMPQEDLVILLHATVEATGTLAGERARQSGNPDDGLDGHEKDTSHLAGVVALYHTLAHTTKHWHTVNCLNSRGAMRTREDIAEEIWEAVLPVLHH